jgi:hypothetical protein
VNGRGGRSRLRLIFCAVKFADCVCANRPRREFQCRGFFAPTDFTLVDAAYERAFDVNVIVFPQLRRGVFAQAVPGDDAVPLGLRVPFLVSALPSAFRRERKDGVLTARLLPRLVLRVLAEITDEMNSVLVHFVSPFLPLELGHTEASGYCSQGERLLFGRHTRNLRLVLEDLLGGTGKAEDAKLPGAGIIPKPCPMERVETEKWTKAESIGATESQNRGRARAVVSVCGDRSVFRTATDQSESTYHTQSLPREVQRIVVLVGGVILVVHNTAGS